MGLFRKLKEIGPGAMVAAAFIGPGTVTTATLSGASYGYTLLWAVVFSTIATMILQEMTARLGLIAKMGVGSALRAKMQNPLFKFLVAFLVIGAILVGNAAYEAGNISGAVLGFSDKWSGSPIDPLVLVIGIMAFILLFSGKYSIIERFLVWLVAFMGMVFLVSAILLKPDIQSVFQGMFIPNLPDGSLLMVLGLIGTTVVPYNLFLHASTVKEKWKGDADLTTVRYDTFLSIAVGGLITMAILITAAVAFEGSGQSVNNLADLAPQLKPILGAWSQDFIALGFLAAGFTSSITAPLAAAFATSEILGWQGGMNDRRFQLIWFFVLLCGVVFSSLGFRPTSVILFAQIANGLLLPIVAIFLLWIMNDRKLLGESTNTYFSNVLGLIVVLITLGLGLKGILSGVNLI